MLRRNQAETMRFFLELDPATLEKMEKLGNFTRTEAELVKMSLHKIGMTKIIHQPGP